MPISLSTTQMIFYSFCVRAARRFRWLPMQRFFRRCPYIFTEGFKIRLLHGASQMKPSFDFDGIDLREILGSGVLAREMADIAADRGYREEGSALYITSARLIHKAYS